MGGGLETVICAWWWWWGGGGGGEGCTMYILALECAAGTLKTLLYIYQTMLS